MKMRNGPNLVAMSIVMACAMTAANVRADDHSMASNYFDAGAQAYDAGQYFVAAEAFLKAHGLIKSPALQFSAAQAYRRQYLVDSSPDALRRAVRLYRDYLRADASGKRREEAVNALSDLVPLEARIRRKSAAAGASTSSDPTGKPGERPAPIPIPVPGSTPPASIPVVDSAVDESEDVEAEPPRKTRLLVSVKPDMAEVSIDGSTFVRVPAIVEVKQGVHQVRAKAAGYFDEAFQIDAVENELVARHVALRPKPGRLSVNSVAGAKLMLDGQLRAVLPHERPLDVEPGEHFVTITRAGRVPFSKTITIAHDKDVMLGADLAMSKQRVGAWSTLVIGLAGAATSGMFAGLTYNQNTIATNLDAQRQSGAMKASDIADFNDALQSRNSFASAAAITGGASVLVLLSSTVMFLFDNPDAIPVPPQKMDSTSPSRRVDLTLGLGSAGVRVDF